MSKGAANEVFDVRRAWRETKRALDAMNDEQRKQTLIDAGILTKSGKVAKPYVGVFKPVSK